MRWARFKPGDKVVTKEAHPGLGLPRAGRVGTVKSVDPGECPAVGVTFKGKRMWQREPVFMCFELKRYRKAAA